MPERFRKENSKHTQYFYTSGSHHAQGWNQSIKNEKNSTKNQQKRESIFEKNNKVDKSLAKLTKSEQRQYPS